jgi:hypothetical protein
LAGEWHCAKAHGFLFFSDLLLFRRLLMTLNGVGCVDNPPVENKLFHLLPITGAESHDPASSSDFFISSGLRILRWRRRSNASGLGQQRA